LWRYQVQVLVLTMSNIVRASSWSQSVGTAFDITGFARPRNATTGDATLSKRLSPTVVAFAAANGSLTVLLRCRDCCKHPRAAFGALSSLMHCWPRQLESCCSLLRPQPVLPHTKRLHGPLGKPFVGDFTHLCFQFQIGRCDAHVHACRGNGIALALSGICLTLRDYLLIRCASHA